MRIPALGASPSVHHSGVPQPGPVPVPIRSFIYALSLLTLAGSALAQQTPKPSRFMQAFRSETELVQYLAALDRDRRQGDVPRTCSSGRGPSAPTRRQ